MDVTDLSFTLLTLVHRASLVPSVDLAPTAERVDTISELLMLV